MIPVPSSSQRNSPEVWARMPDTSSASGDSDVELMAIILGAQNYPNGIKTYSCMAPESRDVWSTSVEEIVHGIRSVRPALSEGAVFKHRQIVGVIPEVEWWQGRDGSRRTKMGVILAGWCERENDNPNASKRYTYWVRCEREGMPATHRWYEQHELFAWPEQKASIAVLPRQRILA